MKIQFTTLAMLALTGTARAALDSNLHRSFWGMSYVPEGVILPDCTATQEQVTEDIKLLAQITPRIRLYGSDCDQTELVLQAIADTNADLTVWPCIYVDVPYNQTVVDRQWNLTKAAFEKHGVDHVAGLTVGNEFLLLSYGIDGGGVPTNPAGVAARGQLLESIQTINESLRAMDLGKHIPVGVSDAGSAVTPELLAGVDYFMANDHPWFGGLTIDAAAGWTWDFLQNNDVVVAEAQANKPVVYIGETGWPTSSDDAEHRTNGASPASVANLQKFLDDYVCAANDNITKNEPSDRGYFYFEFADAIWKERYGGVEPHWGLFDRTKKLKDIKLPECLVESPTGGTVQQLKTDAQPSSGNSNDSNSPRRSSSAFQLAVSCFAFVPLLALPWLL